MRLRGFIRYSFSTLRRFSFFTMVYHKYAHKFFKKLGLLGYSKNRNLFGMNPLVVSTLFVLLTAVIANLLRRIIRNTLPDGIFKQLCYEFIATAELCACCFELAVIADNYGVWVYALYLFLLTIWWSRSWEDATACPYTPMEGILEGHVQIAHAILIILAQLMGGLAIYKYVHALWSLELAQTHMGKNREECSADLQIAVYLGALVEGGATFATRFIYKWWKSEQMGGELVHIAESIFYVLNILFARQYTGGYLNPTLATIINLGCDGVEKLNFVIVYWIAAFAGSLLASFVIKKCFPDTLPTEDEVPMICGAVVEGFATCLCRLASRVLGDSEARFAFIVDPFFATMMVVAAFNYSGGYFNPALATSLKWGCDGQTMAEFLVVYWFGACAGAISSVFIYNMTSFKNLVGKLKHKQE